MPELLIFAVCERAVVDRFTNEFSILFLVENSIPMGEREPQEDDPPHLKDQRYLHSPFMIATVWWRTADDEEQEYEQQVSIVAPDDRDSPISEIQRFKMDHQFHRGIILTGSVAMRMTGIYRLALNIRRVGEEKFTRAKTYPVNITLPTIPISGEPQ